MACIKCGSETMYYDSVRRIKRCSGGVKNFIFVERYKCTNCGFLHRELPEDLIPFKHYEFEIIKGVQEGYITPETYGYEDYPTEQTMETWRKMHMIL